MAHFIRLAVVQSNAFGVLAHAHQRKAEISFKFLLVEIEVNQGLANEVGEPCAYQRIGEREPNHIARNAENVAANVDVEGARQAPQDGDK